MGNVKKESQKIGCVPEYITKQFYKWRQSFDETEHYNEENARKVGGKKD